MMSTAVAWLIETHKKVQNKTNKQTKTNKQKPLIYCDTDTQRYQSFLFKIFIG